MLITAARLFNCGADNCGADSIVEDLLIDVEDGRIVIVARRPTAFIGSPEMLDLGDVTLLPGLIDIHQLLAFDASDDPVAHLFDVNDATLLLRAATICSRHFLCGTTRPAAWCIPCRQYSAELNVYRRALHVHGDGRNRGRTSVAAVPYADERPAGGPQTGSRLPFIVDAALIAVDPQGIGFVAIPDGAFTVDVGPNGKGYRWPWCLNQQTLQLLHKPTTSSISSTRSNSSSYSGTQREARGGHSSLWCTT